MSQQRTPNEEKAILSEIEKELQAETSKEAAPLLEFVLENIQKIILGLVVIVAGIGVFGFVQYKSEADFNKADIELQKITAMSNISQKIEQLIAFYPNAPKGLKTAVALEQARAYMQDNNPSEAINILTNVQKQEKNSALATALAFSLSDIYLANNQPNEALEVLENYLKLAPKSVTANLLEEIANVAIAANNRDRAILAFNSLLLMPDAAQSHPYYQERMVDLSK